MQELLRDPRLRELEWHDLVAVSRAEVNVELLLSAPWLIGSVSAAYIGMYWLALPLSFVFFLTGLRQVHNAHHYALGVSRGSTELVMFVLSVLMLSSMHAIQVTHLHHHRHCMDDEDVEAESARMPAAAAILFGPLFPIKLHCAGFRLAGRRHRIWIWAERTAIIGSIWAVYFALDIGCLRYHLAAIGVGQCLTAFFAVWTVHHGCDGRTPIARTLRNRLKSVIAFDMFYHVEHHLFPKVPTCHLAALAERLDRTAPEAVHMQVY